MYNVLQVGEMLASARDRDGRNLLVTSLRSREAPVVRALLDSCPSPAQVTRRPVCGYEIRP